MRNAASESDIWPHELGTSSCEKFPKFPDIMKPLSISHRQDESPCKLRLIVDTVDLDRVLTKQWACLSHLIEYRKCLQEGQPSTKFQYQIDFPPDGFADRVNDVANRRGQL